MRHRAERWGRRGREWTIGLCAAGALTFGASGAELSLAEGRVEAVSSAHVTFEADGSVVLRSASAEYQSGLTFLPPEGKDAFDLSSARYLALDLESLSTNHQQRLCLQIGDGTNTTYASLALDPGEKATLKLDLPHEFIYASPEGAKGVKTLNTRRITEIALEVIWPYEGQFSRLLDCRISNPRLIGSPAWAFQVPLKEYLPFVDRYGQYAHGTWGRKVTTDAELAADLVAERAALRAPPASWDRFGGYANGPQLEATGNFRVEKVNGKWWFVTPEGHLFYSLGLNVIKTECDAPNALNHPDWYESAPQAAMTFTTWNLGKKFGESDFTAAYASFVMDRLDSWGINTIGNWSGKAFTDLGRKPYVLTLLSKPSTVPYRADGFYDSTNETFAAQMLAAAQDAVAKVDSAAARAVTDPMCIGFFIDNELSFPSDAATYEPYFAACKAAIAAVAPGKLYLGCRFKSLRNAETLWRAAAKGCDVISVNSYVASVEVFGKGAYAAPDLDRPILHSEFHFGTRQRGMFSAGLCPVADQCARAWNYRHVVEGALRHPLIVGSHWFQYRDQPLVGRGDGENYQIGFVDVCDRPYETLTKAVRAVAETMYEERSR